MNSLLTWLEGKEKFRVEAYWRTDESYWVEVWLNMPNGGFTKLAHARSVVSFDDAAGDIMRRCSASLAAFHG